MTALVSGLKKLGADILAILTSRDRMKAIWRHPLYANAIYIMLAKATDAVVGLVFWIVAARLYSGESVGHASALLSATTLLCLLSGLGLGYGLIRYLGESRDKVALINSTFAVAAPVATAAVVLFVFGPGVWSPAIMSLREQPGCLALFVVTAPVATVAVLSDNTFIALRTARYLLARNLVLNLLRLVLPIVLAAYLQSFGLFSSWSAAVCVSVLLSILLFLPRAQPGYRSSLNFDRHAVSHLVRFSFMNYLCDLFWSAPILILQSIVVANRLGSESNAYFAVAWAMGNVLVAVPYAVSMSLFAEGSHDEAKLGRSLRQSLKMTFLMLTPAVILVTILADKILLVFRPEYSEHATTLLRLFAVASFPVAANYLYFGTKRVQGSMSVVVLLIASAGAATLALSYVLMPRMGVTGGGVAWLASQSCVSLFVLTDWFRATVKMRAS